MQYRLTHVAPRSGGILSLTWTDGFQADVDLNFLMDRGDLTVLRDGDVFAGASLAEDGYVVSWPLRVGTPIEFSSDGLRVDAIDQAAHRTAAE